MSALSWLAAILFGVGFALAVACVYAATRAPIDSPDFDAVWKRGFAVAAAFAGAGVVLGLVEALL